MTAPAAFDAWAAVDRTTRIRLLATLVEERAGDDANTSVETFPSIVAAMRVIKSEAERLDDDIERAFPEALKPKAVVIPPKPEECAPAAHSR